MAKKISQEDKVLIKKRIAKGESYKEAKRGTDVVSIGSVHNIVKSDLKGIERLREKYLSLIEQFDAGEVDRAGLWAKMTYATKPIGAMILIDKNGKVIKAENEGMIEVPDWAAREKALKYIDGLAGYGEEKGTRIGIIGGDDMRVEFITDD